MILRSNIVQRGRWVTIGGADLQDTSPVSVNIGDVEKFAFVDNSNYVVRCPRDIEPGVHNVIVNGVSIGRVTVY